MDNNPTKKEKSTLTKAAQPTKFSACSQLVVNIVMMVFSGIYAFNNPDGYTDNKGCYVYKVGDE